MDFGLILGILVVVAIGVYIWLGRENDKLDGLDEAFPSDCSVDTKPDVINPAKPVKAEPVFAKSVLAPEAAVEEKVVTVQSDPQPVVEKKAKPMPSAAQQPEAAKPKVAKPKGKAQDAVTREQLEGLTKKQIDELAVKHGVELDARKTKAVMIDTFLKSL